MATKTALTRAVNADASSDGVSTHAAMRSAEACNAPQRSAGMSGTRAGMVKALRFNIDSNPQLRHDLLHAHIHPSQ
eukprot:1963846-Rhodomonas_salina.1